MTPANDQSGVPGMTDRAGGAKTGMAHPVVTVYDPTPIPIRRFDWSAYREGYEGGDPLGFGPTREAAIADLLEEEEWRKS